MASGKLLILGALAMATTLVVVTQAQSAELDGLKHPPCLLILQEPCELHLTGRGSMWGCCHILAILHSEGCQCSAMERISNHFPGVDREYARNLPKKCGTLNHRCSFKMPYM